MIKHEASFTTKLNKWLRHNWSITGPIEVKVSKTGRINIHQFADHQLAALRQASVGRLIWKIPDAGWTNPFDIIVYNQCIAFVCLVFNIETSKKFYMINANTFIKYFKDHDKVSLTEEEATIMAHTIAEVA
jgi:penicillin-binding protein-related factor A (putative recombinase)